MVWQVPEIWKDGEVWILGGGPSIPKQFNIPENIINDVVAGKLKPSAYSPYMEKIHNKHVIGINVSYLFGDWVDIVFFGDNTFFLNNIKGLADFSGLVVSCAPTVDKHNWVKYIPRESNKNFGISSRPNAVSWNGNSGAAAISVAAHSGAKRIILLGFDMKLSNENQHWHDLYGRLSGNKIKPRQLPFDRHLKGFPQIAKDAKRMGIEIINANPESAIDCFSKCNVKDLL